MDFVSEWVRQSGKRRLVGDAAEDEEGQTRF